MQRRPSAFLAAAFALAAATALAQGGGDLAGVTMRVLDDVGDIDAVVLELDANRDDDEAGAEREGGGRRDDDRSPDDSAQPSADERGDDRLDDGGEDDELHDREADERREGRLEDNDVERPAAAPPTP